MPSDDRAQMMILTAVVLILAFVALGAMVGRISQLANETQRETDTPIRQEIDAVAGALEEIIDQAVADAPAVIQTQLDGSLLHLQQLEGSRGFRLSYALGCESTGVGLATLHLDDGMTRLGLTRQYPDVLCL